MEVDGLGLESVGGPTPREEGAGGRRLLGGHPLAHLFICSLELFSSLPFLSFPFLSFSFRYGEQSLVKKDGM